LLVPAARPCCRHQLALSRAQTILLCDLDTVKASKLAERSEKELQPGRGRQPERLEKAAPTLNASSMRLLWIEPADPLPVPRHLIQRAN